MGVKQGALAQTYYNKTTIDASLFDENFNKRAVVSSNGIVNLVPGDTLTPYLKNNEDLQENRLGQWSISINKIDN